MIGLRLGGRRSDEQSSDEDDRRDKCYEQSSGRGMAFLRVGFRSGSGRVCGEELGVGGKLSRNHPITKSGGQLAEEGYELGVGTYQVSDLGLASK